MTIMKFSSSKIDDFINIYINLIVSSLYFLQISLYEDLVAAWVPAKHEWLRQRPMGEELVNRLGKQKMFSYCACILNLVANLQLTSILIL